MRLRKHIIPWERVKMKTIIKEGKKKFTITCPRCGCEFEYEIKDISFDTVDCPCCYGAISHPNQSEQDNTAKRRSLGGTVITTYPPKYVDDIDILNSLCSSDSSQTDNTVITTIYNDNTENKYE